MATTKPLGLFAALQSITSTFGRSHVTFEEWCRFWFQAPKRYSATILPKAIENFSHFGILESWSNKNEVLTFLNVLEEHRQPVYLAATLSCWLCAFVLPLKNLGCIRPSVFKPASQLASEQSCSNFSATYVHAWTTQYFRSHCMSVHDFAGAQMIAFHGASNGTKAKAFIRSRQDINWIGNCMRNTRDRLLVDDSTLRQDADFLLSIRSCFLTLRYDNDHVVELYSPHRRAFSIIPMVPVPDKYSSRNETFYFSPGPSHSPPLIGSSRKRKADDDNDTKAGSSDESKSKLQKSSPKISREPSPPHEKECQEKAFSQSPDERIIFHDIFGEDEATLRKKQKNDQDEDDFDLAKELEAIGNTFASDSQNAKELEHTSTSVDPNVLVAASDPVAMYAAATIIARDSEAVHDAPPIPIVASSSKAQDMISEADRYAVGFLVKQMKTKLLHTPLSNIRALDPELKELFGYITLKNIDVVSLREHVEAYINRALSFHALESLENVQPPISSLEERLICVESHLSDVVNLKRKEEEQIKSQQAEILEIQ
ncbi:Tryptophan N-acetyltransferase ivoA [Bienertia sinuspersici]